MALAEPTRPGDRPVYYVTRWADVDAVLRDPATFSSSINAQGAGQFMGPIMLSMDGEQHRAHRFSSATPSAPRSWRAGRRG